MSTYLSLQTGSGRRILIEVASLHRVTDSTADIVKTSAAPGDIIREADKRLREVVDGLRDLFEELDHALEAVPRRLHEVEISFQARIQGAANLVVVAGESEATFHIVARWKLQ